MILRDELFNMIKGKWFFYEEVMLDRLAEVRQNFILLREINQSRIVCDCIYKLGDGWCYSECGIIISGFSNLDLTEVDEEKSRLLNSILSKKL